MSAPLSITHRGPTAADAAMRASLETLALGWIPGDAVRAGCSSAAIRANPRWGFGPIMAAVGHASASAAATTTAVARVVPRCLRSLEFARKLKLPGRAWNRVATCVTRRSGSPRNSKPNRTANSPRL